jgi:hypothetical protein
MCANWKSRESQEDRCAATNIELLRSQPSFSPVHSQIDRKSAKVVVRRDAKHWRVISKPLTSGFIVPFDWYYTDRPDPRGSCELETQLRQPLRQQVGHGVWD